MKTFLKEIWQVYLPKILKAIYDIALKPKSSIGWTAGILLAYVFFMHCGFILKLIAVVNAIPAAILCFKKTE
jgi:hypothetical protein